MSRIGRNPITLPAGVSAVVEGNKITVTGPLGTLSQEFDSVNVNVDNNVITLTRKNDENEVKAKHGLYRALIANMVTGVKEGSVPISPAQAVITHRDAAAKTSVITSIILRIRPPLKMLSRKSE